MKAGFMLFLLSNFRNGLSLEMVWSCRKDHCLDSNVCLNTC